MLSLYFRLIGARVRAQMQYKVSFWLDLLGFASQLIFTSTFDGQALEPYLEALRTHAEPDAWWQFCAGYPGSAEPGFADWVRAHQITSSLFASAHPQARVPHVLESLELRERIVDFAIETRGLDAAALQSRFRETFA